MPKISIIIPVYNSEKFLPRCLNSVLAQTYSDYEVICIDDGSTDGSLHFWPDNWFKSFRFHCIPFPLLRYFVSPSLPNINDLKMIAFHGITGIPQALKGVWCDDVSHPKYPKGWKKIYKHIRPAKWIATYWK